MRKLLLILASVLLIVILGAVIWAVQTFVYLGPAFPRRDFLRDVIEQSAERLDMDPQDQRASDAFEVIYQKYLEIEQDELGLFEIRKSDFTGRPSLTSVLFEDAWYVPEHIASVEEDEYLFPTIIHKEGWQDRRDVAEHLLARFDEEGMTALVDEALALPGFIPSERELRNRIVLPRLGLYTAAQVEHLRAQRAVQEGDFETVFQAMDRIGTIRRFLHGYPAAHTHRLACLTDELVISIVRSVLASESVSEAELGQMAGLVPIPPEDVMRDVLEYQRAYALDRLQTKLPSDSLLKRHSYSYHANRINDWVDRFVSYSTKPRQDRLQMNDPARHPDGSIDNWIEEWNDMPAQTMWPFPFIYTRASEVSMARVGGFRLLIAIERHGLRHGGYPVSLDDIDPEFMPQRISDPYAPDGAFRYRRFDEPDEHGRGYVLYSVGVDGRDDTGFYHCIYLQDERQLGDFIFNPQPFNNWDEHTEYYRQNPL